MWRTPSLGRRAKACQHGRVPVPPYAGRWLRATHPRGSGPAPQVAVLCLALLVGAVIGLGLLAADRASWSGGRVATAVVTGRSAMGVLALADGRTVVLHLARIPRPGTTLSVELSRDGRARPLSYRQTPGRALRSGVLLTVGLTVLVQAYRWVVTRRPR